MANSVLVGCSQRTRRAGREGTDDYCRPGLRFPVLTTEGRPPCLHLSSADTVCSTEEDSSTSVRAGFGETRT